MNEIELKFQIPAGQVERVRQQIEQLAAQSGQPAQTLPLHAAYFDTPDHALARQKCALRVRREGDAWVQTFKGAGVDAMTRLEENRDVPPPPDGQPRPDLSCHGAEVQASLQRVLNWSPEADPRGEALGLHALYETRFQRLHAQQGSGCGTACVVVCLDEGVIIAGSLQAQLGELELELNEGTPGALIELAQTWVRQHGVWLDVQSKAMKGTRLARADANGQAVSAQALHLPNGWVSAFEAPAINTGEAPHAWRKPLSLCLDVAAGNWAEVAFGHLHWELALSAWLEALQALQHTTQAHAALADWLGPDVLALQADLLQALSSLCLEEQADAQAAQALATSAAPTLWALGVLKALQQAR
jgi:triphosphatase